jgi:signal transduction histidine kinase
MASPLRITVRLRLTLLYGGMVLLSGGALIAIFYTISRANYPGGDALDNPYLNAARSQHFKAIVVLPSGSQVTYAGLHSIQRTLDQHRSAALAALLWQCLTALAALGVIAIMSGWWLAGRALRPVHDITAAARRVAVRSLHERIGLQGPRDEITELADTFDAMLERLDASFDIQRQFVANASHELRTPLATSRTLLEVTLAQQQLTPEVRHVLHALLATSQRNEALIDGLLTLARSEIQHLPRQPVDLSDIAAEAIEHTAHEVSDAGITIDADPGSAPTSGDPVLLERVALNLIRNPIAYNHRGGHVAVRTGPGTDPGEVELSVTNTGPVVDPGDVEAMFEPFRRLGDTRADHDHGVGLGLSIVRSIAATHDGYVTATPRRDGGLTIIVHLPVATHTQGPEPERPPRQPSSTTSCRS